MECLYSQYLSPYIVSCNRAWHSLGNTLGFLFPLCLTPDDVWTIFLGSSPNMSDSIDQYTVYIKSMYSVDSKLGKVEETSIDVVI